MLFLWDGRMLCNQKYWLIIYVWLWRCVVFLGSGFSVHAYTDSRKCVHFKKPLKHCWYGKVIVVRCLFFWVFYYLLEGCLGVCVFWGCIYFSDILLLGHCGNVFISKSHKKRIDIVRWWLWWWWFLIHVIDWFGCVVFCEVFCACFSHFVVKTLKLCSF